MNTIEFEGFGKIPRLNRDCVVTEKLDGTNAQIYIEEHDISKVAMDHPGPADFSLKYAIYTEVRMTNMTQMVVRAGSRKRWINPTDDNFGFARWVCDNVSELLKLGPGRHFGEWWGQGIQRGYGLDEKRFSLFNTARWEDSSDLPACVDVVPELFRGPFRTEVMDTILEELRSNGSRAVPGYMNPEGIMVWHEAGRQLFKATCTDDDKPKGK